MLPLEFSAELLTKPVIYVEVDEGHFQIARPVESYGHLVTFGLVTCMAISLHDHDTNTAALVHLDEATELKPLLDTVVDAFPGDPFTADIKIVQANTDTDNADWPSIENITSYFMQFNPRSLLVDRNRRQHHMRGVALELKTGILYETAYESEAIRQSRQIRKRSQPLHA